jgi:trehalose 6-phosphate phosphatase
LIFSSERKLLVLDFDGTLAEIADHPELATLTPGSREVIGRLAKRPDFVVVICSGRSIADVRHRADIEEVIYAGNHGLEIDGRGIEFLAPDAAAIKRDLAMIAFELRIALATTRGTEVEDKGLSIAVHYRRARRADIAFIGQTVQRIARTRTRFDIGLGKMVFEVRPRDGWNKGKAASWIRARVGCDRGLPIVIGDDFTDEDMFAQLSDGVTIRVGLDAPTCARHRLHSPPEVVRFLAWLATAPLPTEQQTRRRPM